MIFFNTIFQKFISLIRFSVLRQHHSKLSLSLQTIICIKDIFVTTMPQSWSQFSNFFRSFFSLWGHSNDTWHFLAFSWFPLTPSVWHFILKIILCLKIKELRKYFYSLILVGFLLLKALKQCFKNHIMFMWHFVQPHKPPRAVVLNFI